MGSVSDADEAVLAEIAEETGVSYDPGSGDVEFAGASTDTEQYVALVEYQVENGYVTEEHAPVSAERAQTRYLINSTTSHENRDMIRPREVGDGLHLETNHDSTSKQRYGGRFIETFVLDG